MEQFKPQLYVFVVEVRYGDGLLYFDKCGQTIMDIENTCDNWVFANVDTHTGAMYRADVQFNMNFSNSAFSFNTDKAFKHNIEYLADEAAKLWRVVKANLGIENIIRIGFRQKYFIPTKSIEQANELIKKSAYKIRYPEGIAEKGYGIKDQILISTLVKEPFEYRIHLMPITRAEGYDPTNLFKQDPRSLSQRQKKARLEALKYANEYKANPMYAVCLDIDAIYYLPANSTIDVKEYILRQSDIMKNDFLTILEAICQHK